MRISDWSSDVCSSDLIFVQCVIVYRDHSHRRSLYPGSGRDVPSATALQSSTHRMLRRLVFSMGFVCGFFGPLSAAAAGLREFPLDTFSLAPDPQNVRVGKGGFSRFRSWWWRYIKKKKIITKIQQ